MKRSSVGICGIIKAARTETVLFLAAERNSDDRRRTRLRNNDRAGIRTVREI